MSVDGLRSRVGNQKYLLLLRSVKHAGTPEFELGPYRRKNHFDLYGFLPTEIGKIPTPPLMDPDTLTFHLESVYALNLPTSVTLRPTLIDSQKGHAEVKKSAHWEANDTGGHNLPTLFPPLYPGDRIRVFGWSSWNVYNRVKFKGEIPTGKTTRQIVVGLLFTLQWIPLRKGDQDFEVVPDPTVGIKTTPKMAHEMSLASNTPWARKMKRSKHGAPRPVQKATTGEDALQEELSVNSDGVPLPPRRRQVPETRWTAS